MKPAELQRILNSNPDLTLVMDEQGRKSIMPTEAARRVVQAGIRSEHDLQREVFNECARRALHDDRYGDIYANVNGQYRQGQRMEPGLRRGVPDIFVAVPSGPYAGMYVELKWRDNKPDRDQLEWMRRLRQRGYKCVVIWDEVSQVMDAIENYLEEA